MKYQKIHNKIYIYIYISKTYISPKESQNVVDNLRKIIIA